ncbi:MAG: glycosyltransferase family 4 protein [Ekhidna sp.]
MKIAFVTNTCWNIYNFRKGLALHFIEEGHEVIALAPRDKYTEEIEKWGIRFIETPLDGTGVNPLKDAAYLLQLIKVFKNEKPDISLSYTIKSNIYSSLAGKVSKVSTICNVSGLGTTFLVKGMVGKLAIRLYKTAFKYSHFIFFQNEDDEKLFTSIVKVAQERRDILPGSGIDLQCFSYSKLEVGAKTNFLMISRLIIEKGVREYAEAAAEFINDSTTSFALVGRLDESHSRSISRDELEEWKRNGLTYLDHSDDIAQVIKNHDVIVLPSYREGTPRTLLESAAIGRPLLTSNVPGCKEVVSDGFNGYLFEAKSAKSIIDKVKLFLSLSDYEKLQLGFNSRKLVEEKFDENYVIDKYMNVINRIAHDS